MHVCRILLSRLRRDCNYDTIRVITTAKGTTFENKQPERWGKEKKRIRYANTSHPVRRLYRDRLPALSCRRRKRVPTVVEPHVERPPPIHILLELSCMQPLAAKEERKTDREWGVPMAVSASATCANCTTPAPLERVPSNKISASSTWPVVSNSSTRSSFAVDHGSYASCASGQFRQYKVKEGAGQLTLRTMICRLGSASYPAPTP